MPPVLSDGVQVHLDTRSLQAEMIDTIKRHFGDLLGSDVALLETPGGLDVLAARLHARAAAF